jgi:hypothetical protein
MSPPSRRPIVYVTRAALLWAALAACSSKESDGAQTATADSIASALPTLHDTASPGGTAPAPHLTGPPTGKIRVANLAERDGKPIGPVDLYDVWRPDSTSTPILTNLAFGQISAYVSPHAPIAGPGQLSNLYMFPAGSRTVALPYGALEMSGYVQGDQVTVVLAPSPMGGTAIARFDVAEEGKRIVQERQDAQHVIPSGQALLLVRDADRGLTELPEQYIMVDGACPHPPKMLPMNDGMVPIAPGTHTLGVVTSPRGQGLVNCKGKSPGATTTLTVQAGRRYLAVIYGLPSDGFKVLATPIDPP